MRLAPALAILLAAGCGPWRPTHVRIDPELKTLVPPDTVMLVGARLDQVRETPLYQKHIATESAPALEEFIKTTGVDPRKDIWEILAAYNGKDMVLMTRGKVPEAQREGAKRDSYKGYTLIGDEQAAILLVDSNTAVTGRREVLRSIVDHRAESSGPSASLLEKIHSIEPTNQIWAVSVGGLSPAQVPQAANVPALNRVLQMPQGLTAAVNLHNGLLFTARAECASAEDAEALQGALRALIGLLRLGTRNERPALQHVYDAISVGRQDGVVEIRADLPMELMDQVLQESRK